MWIYLLIGLLLLILASESYFKGGVNALLTLLGVVLAVNVADSFGPMAFQWMGDNWWPLDTHPFWNRAVPVVAGFITLVVIFSIAGTVASIMLRKRLESQWEDYKLENYKTMNRKFGLCVGLITASVYSVMGLTHINRLGNFTGPLRHDTDPWPLKTLNEAREQLDNTPFIKLAAAYDKTPKLDYEVRDTLALLLKNRASTIEGHMRAYPRAKFSEGLERQFTPLVNTEFDNIADWSNATKTQLVHPGCPTDKNCSVRSAGGRLYK